MSLLFLLSCERRELTYNYQPTVSVVVNTDWSSMDEAPSGMSLYFYPEDGGSPTIVQTNSTTTATVNLSEGIYNILVFNQIPSDYGTISFGDMDSYSTAEAYIVNTKSSWAASISTSTSKTDDDDDDYAREPEELAVSTYEGFEVTKEAILESIKLQSKGLTKSDIDPYATLSFTPKVVIKTTRVRIRVSGIDNHQSTRATLYGMSTGYHFANQASHSTMTTHLLETWTVTTYEDDPTEGELTASFTSFGLPEQSTSTRGVEQWADWDGRLDIEVLLVDNETVVSESVMLADKITASDSDARSDDVDADIDTDIDADIDTDIDSNLDLDFDLAIEWGFDDDGDDDGDDDDGGSSALTLPDVDPAGSGDSVGGGFGANLSGWGDQEIVDLQF